MSDQLKGEKFWPFVRHQKTSCPSSIYIADKNTPPNAWRTVKEIVSESRGFSVGVLPENNALSTTSVIGSFCKNNDGTSKEMPLRHCYPFSLPFLAVCMSRVLARPLKSHPGKLDSAIKNACMVVVQFFSFFRGLSADMLVEQLSYAERKGSIIRIPFFLENCSTKLPEKLEECLLDALRLQFEIDRREEDALSSVLSRASTEMEQRLRSLLTKHTLVLQSMTVAEEVSQQSFLIQVSELASSLLLNSRLPVDGLSNPLPTAIRIVSIDIDVDDVRQLIIQESFSDADLANFILGIGGLDESKRSLANNCLRVSKEELDNDENTKISRCISKTHLTMVHSSQSPQSQMREQFAKFLGMKFDVTVSGIHFSPSVAALDVTDVHPVGSTDSAMTDFPHCANLYPHITVWCSAGVPPHESNSLPKKLKEGEAIRIIFGAPTKLRGTLKFWENVEVEGEHAA